MACRSPQDDLLDSAIQRASQIRSGTVEPGDGLTIIDDIDSGFVKPQIGLKPLLSVVEGPEEGWSDPVSCPRLLNLLSGRVSQGVRFSSGLIERHSRGPDGEKRELTKVHGEYLERRS